MALKQPESMDEIIYFTQRSIGSGKARVWVFKKMCPECGKALMGKPVEKGSVKIRAKEYKCPQCGYTEEKKAYEESLTASIEYTCPECSNSGELEIPFKRKKVKGVEMLRANCEKCGAEIDITKKMKEKK